MENFRVWLMQKDVWCNFSKTNHVKFQWLIKYLERGPIGLGMVGLYKFCYSFIAQVSFTFLII